MSQDPSLEFPQLRARVDAQFPYKAVARCLENRERLGLSACGVQADHQLADQALSQRVFAHQPLHLGEQVGSIAGFEVGLDPILERPEPSLLQLT